MRKALIVSLHDVTPARYKELKQCTDMLDRCGLRRCSQLVVPLYHGTPLGSDRGFLDWLRDRCNRGDEIVLHGYRHEAGPRAGGIVRSLRRALFTRGEGEFLGLDNSAADTLLKLGRSSLEDLSLKTTGFVAPAWLIEPNLYPLLRHHGFRYTTRQSGIIDLRTENKLTAHTVVLRGSSQLMNRISRGYGNMFMGILQKAPVIRIAIHPADAGLGALPWLQRTIQTLLQQREAHTYASWLQTLS